MPSMFRPHCSLDTPTGTVKKSSIFVAHGTRDGPYRAVYGSDASPLSTGPFWYTSPQQNRGAQRRERTKKAVLGSQILHRHISLRQALPTPPPPFFRSHNRTLIGPPPSKAPLSTSRLRLQAFRLLAQLEPITERPHVGILRTQELVRMRNHAHNPCVHSRISVRFEAQEEVTRMLGVDAERVRRS